MPTAEQRAKYQSLGQCQNCGKRPPKHPNGFHCTLCLETVRRARIARVRRGLCLHCGTETHGFNQCDACLERRREAHQKNPESNRLSVRKWQTDPKNAAKLAAKECMNTLTALGIVIKPYRCQQGCGRAATEAHHVLGYDIRYWACVQWLCTECHNRTRQRYVA